MESKNRARAGMRREKRKEEGKDPEGGSKKRKEAANDNSLASISQVTKQQAVSDLNKARDAYNAQLQRGKEIGLDEASAGRACAKVRKGHTRHSRDGDGACNSAKTQCGPKVYPKAFRSRGSLCHERARRPSSSTISRLHHHSPTDCTDRGR